jgi:hypothetical protein
MGAASLLQPSRLRHDMSEQLDRLALDPTRLADVHRWDGISTTPSKAATRSRLEAMAAEAQASLPDWAMKRATETFLADVDSLANWIACECAYTGRVSSDWESRVAGRMEEAATSTLLHAATMAAERNDAAACLQAVKILTDRWLVKHDLRVRAMAAEMAS